MNAPGGSAVGLDAQETSEPEDEWTKHLRVELAAAVRRCVVTNARLGLVLRGDRGDPCDLAKAADEATLAAGHVAGFAKLLCKVAPILLLSFL
jgi:hypothetical protein